MAHFVHERGVIQLLNGHYTLPVKLRKGRDHLGLRYAKTRVQNISLVVCLQYYTS